MTLTVCLPDHELDAYIEDLDGVRVVHWDWEAPAPVAGLFVLPYMSPPALLRKLDGREPRLVQSQMIGYDGVADTLPPGLAFANAVSVHEESTAELAVALTLATVCGVGEFVREGMRGQWSPRRRGSIADADALVVGFGGVGRLIVDRLRPLCRSITAVGRTPRTEHGVAVIDMEAMRAQLASFSLIVLAVPLDDSTRQLADAEFIAALRPGTALVNVARGGVVDTEALVVALQAGRVVAGLDVTDPEPLPPDHPLWLCPGVVITPHVGGNSTAMAPRMGALLVDQIERLQSGRVPRNLVSLDR